MTVFFCKLYFSKSGLFALFLGELLEIRIDKAVDITVHNGVDVTVLKAGSCVLCQSVGHKYVASDLATPLDVRLVALDILDLVELLADLSAT